MTVGEVIQRVESLLVKGVSASLPGHISRRWIYSMLRTYRSKLISQKINKKQKISDWMKKTIQCVEVITVPASECPCIVPDKCVVRRTKYKLPEIMTGLSDYAIYGVYNVSNRFRIDVCGINESRYRLYSKNTYSRPFCYFKDGFMYFINAWNIDAVNITALFEDPVEADAFSAEHNPCSGNDSSNQCVSPLDSDFGIDDDMVDTVVKMSVQEITLMFLKQNQEDTNKEEKEEGNE